MKDLNIPKIKLAIKKLAPKYQLSLVLLFGSQATGKTHFGSDADIAYLAEKRTRPIKEARMALEFSKKLKINARDLELVNLKEAPPFLLRQIADKSILLYEKEALIFANFKIYAFKRFMEAQKLFKLKEKSLNKFLRQKV